MMRHLGVVLSVLMAIGLFQVKYCVLDLEQELSLVYADIFAAEESIHMLKAEWSYLNEPQRLQTLAKKYLEMSPTQGIQLVSLDTLHDPGEYDVDASTLEVKTFLASVRGF